MDSLTKEYENNTNNLFFEHMSLCPIIVKKIISNHPNYATNYEDMLQDAYLGLLQAIRAYSDDKGVTFATFATYRIKGEIFDAIRRNDTLPRHWRDLERAASKYIEEIKEKEKRTPDDNELATYLSISHERLETLKKLSSVQEIPIEVSIPYEEKSYEQVENKMFIDQMIGILNDREKIIIKRVYFDGDTLTKIANDDKISKSRASQLRERAMRKLKSHFFIL